MDVIVRYSWALGLAGSVLLGGAAIGTYALGGRMDGAPTWLAIAGAVLLLAYPVLDRQRVQSTVSSRTFVLGSGSSLMVALATAIAIALYVLAARNDHTWDLTDDAVHTLSDQTVKVARELTEPIEVLAFFRGGSPGEGGFTAMADLVKEQSSQFQVTYVDPLRSPRKAAEHEISGNHGTVLLRRGDKEQRLEWPFEEERLTRAMLLLNNDVEHIVCWSTNHGEPDPDDEFNGDGMGGVVTALETLNYKVQRQPVASVGIDRACEILVIARPQLEWLPFELEALAAYLGEGGRVFVLTDPTLTPGLAAEFERYGVRVGDDLVIDLNPMNQMMGVNDVGILLIGGQGLLSHPITDSLSSLLMPVVRSVSPIPEREGVKVRALLQTTEDAWGERNPDDPNGVGPDNDELQGAVPVAVVVEIEDPSVLDVAQSTSVPREAPPDMPIGEGGKPSTVVNRAPETLDLQGDPGRAVPADYRPEAGGRLVVIGNSRFAWNDYLPTANNRDLFLNTIAWLVEEEGQLGERPQGGETLEITTFGEAMLCIISIVLVPGGAMLLAFATLLRRRFL